MSGGPELNWREYLENNFNDFSVKIEHGNTWELGEDWFPSSRPEKLENLNI